MTRTTIDIDAPVLSEIKNIQKKEGQSMGKIVSRLLVEALAQRESSKEAPNLQWVSQPMHPRLDLSDKEAIYAILDKDKK